jgi:hypothetical protein
MDTSLVGTIYFGPIEPRSEGCGPSKNNVAISGEGGGRKSGEDFPSLTAMILVIRETRMPLSSPPDSRDGRAAAYESLVIYL